MIKPSTKKHKWLVIFHDGDETSSAHFTKSGAVRHADAYARAYDCSWTLFKLEFQEHRNRDYL